MYIFVLLNYRFCLYIFITIQLLPVSYWSILISKWYENELADFQNLICVCIHSAFTLLFLGNAVYVLYCTGLNNLHYLCLLPLTKQLLATTTN